MDIGARVKQVRKEKGLTQQSIADRLSLKRQTIAAYEIGAVTPSDRTILDICREFDVREAWLRTGEGEMFAEKSRTDEIAAFMGDILHGEPDFRQRFITVLSRMTPEEWGILEKKVLELAGEIKESGP